MNAKQKLFIAKYLQCFNATQAAIEAGYSERTAYSIGSRLLKNVEVELHIKKYLSDNILSAKEVLYHLSTVACDIANETTANRLTALGLLARYHQLTNTINVKDWRDEVLVLIRQGTIDYQGLKATLSSLGEDTNLARELFYIAGYDVDTLDTDSDNVGY